MNNFGEIRDKIEADGINVEKCVKELAVVTMDLAKACGRMVEQEYLISATMFSATGNSGGGGGGGGFHGDIMEHKVVMNLRAVSGDKSLFRQWRHKFTTSLGQIGGAPDEIFHRLVEKPMWATKWRKLRQD